MLVRYGGSTLEPPDDPMRILKQRSLRCSNCHRGLEPPDDPMRILKHARSPDLGRGADILEPPDDPMRILKHHIQRRVLVFAVQLEPPDDPMRILKLPPPPRRLQAVRWT